MKNAFHLITQRKNLERVGKKSNKNENKNKENYNWLIKIAKRLVNAKEAEKKN